MSKFNSFILIQLLVLIVTFNVKADTLNIASPYWQDFTNKDGSGIYFDLIRNVYPKAKLTISVGELTVAKQQLVRGYADIVIGVYQEELPVAHYSTWHLDTDAPVVAFYLSDNNMPLEDAHMFEGKSIAWLEGFNFEKMLPKRITPYQLKQRDGGFKMLINKRIDYFVDYKDNLPPALKDKISYVPLNKGKKLYLAFQSSEKGSRLAQQYDQMMPRLRANGKLSTIFGSDYQLSGHAEFHLGQEDQ